MKTQSVLVLRIKSGAWPFSCGGTSWLNPWKAAVTNLISWRRGCSPKSDLSLQLTSKSLCNPSVFHEISRNLSGRQRSQRRANGFAKKKHEGLHNWPTLILLHEACDVGRQLQQVHYTGNSFLNHFLQLVWILPWESWYSQTVNTRGHPCSECSAMTPTCFGLERAASVIHHI